MVSTDSNVIVPVVCTSLSMHCYHHHCDSSDNDTVIDVTAL